MKSLNPATRREIARGDSAAALSSAALLIMALHQHPEGAISRLERAREQAPGDASIASDLAAIYLEQGLSGDDPRAIFKALCAAQLACRLRPQLAEARFNLGLALESLFMPDPARNAFMQYLALDPDSGWAREARDHVRRLSRPSREALWRMRKEAVDSAALHRDNARLRELLKGFPQHARFHVEQELLPQWAAYYLQGDASNAATTLSTIRELATQLESLTGDAMLRRVVVAIDRSATDGVARAALADGHRLFLQGVKLYSDYRIDEAAVALKRARLALSRGGSIFRLWAAQFEAACDYHRSAYAEAARKLDATEAEPDIALYPALAGNVEWLRGLCHFVGGSLMDARASYLAALSHFKRAGEIGSAATIESLLFEIDHVLGEDHEAFRHLLCALGGADCLIEPRNRQLIARSAAEAIEDLPEAAAAVYFEDEAVHWAKASGNPIPLAVALRDRANLLHRIGAEDAALKEITVARRLAQQVGDDALTADVLVAEAGILGTEQSTRALADLSTALPVLEKTKYVESLAALYLYRGRLRVRAGSINLAAADFRAGIRQLEHLSTALDDGSRIRYLDRLSELFDEMLRLESDEETSPLAAAFGYAERARGRALAQLMSERERAAVPALSLDAAANRLPRGVTLIEYAVLPEQVLAWVITRGAARSIVLPMGEAELKRKVLRFRSVIAGGTSVDAASSALFRELIAPLRLPPSTEIVIVPDKCLHQLPFSALKDPTSGHYLIEEHIVKLAPSASIYLECAAEVRKRNTRSASVLIVADPAFDRSLAPTLPRLPFAAGEAAAIARSYRQADLLTGAQATSIRFLHDIGRYRIVHFAGHAELDSRSPYLSRLLLAPAAGSSGVLFARDLSGRSFPETELIVLAACNTAGDQVSDSEGVSSLARPFLAAGVPAVIASMWAVEDAGTAALSLELHRLLGNGLDAAGALRGAMLHLLRSHSPEWAAPHTWAAFELFGAATAPTKGELYGRPDHAAHLRNGLGNAGLGGQRQRRGGPAA